MKKQVLHRLVPRELGRLFDLNFAAYTTLKIKDSVLLCNQSIKHRTLPHLIETLETIG